MDSETILPSTLLEAVTHFKDYENCHRFMIVLRWPDGIVRCPRCGSDNVSYLPNARVFKCYEKHAQQKFSLKVGTIFEDSPIGLDKWLPVMWQIVNCKNGISSWEIHRAVGVTQKTAWFMLQRARLAMQDEKSGGKLGGEVEIDETFIGGKVRNMHKDRKMKVQQGPDARKGNNKAIVLGMLERKGRVRTAVLGDRKKKSIAPHIIENIAKGAEIHTDEFSQGWYDPNQFVHNVVNHAVQYVDGNVHTNGIENFWSLLKRTLGGTYVSVEPFHLFRYLDEQAFRFNYRKHEDGEVMNDGERFVIAMRQIVGRRLTWKELIGKEEVRAEAF
jgi:transposase-like protein